MIEFFSCTFGSHLYGTSTPTSDIDKKSLFLPSGKDIIMQKAPNVLSHSVRATDTIKHGQGDIDHELISLKKFMAMLSCGDMIATELLFIPEKNITNKKNFIYDEIVENKDKLISRKVEGFIGYCRKQAAKYGIKGSRIACVREALALIDNHPTHNKVFELAHHIQDFVITHKDYSSIALIAQPGGQHLYHWEVCDRKIPYTVQIKEARNILQKIFNNYGERTRQAERNEGVDFKAVAHAIRVSEQAEELLTTGRITFPRPNAAELVKIKYGIYPYALLAEILEKNLDYLEDLMKITDVLPESSDKDFMEEFVARNYLQQVVLDY